MFKTYCALVNLVIELRFKLLGIQGTVRLCLTQLLVTLKEILTIKMLPI